MSGEVGNAERLVAQDHVQRGGEPPAEAKLAIGQHDRHPAGIVEAHPLDPGYDLVGVPDLRRVEYAPQLTPERVVTRREEAPREPTRELAFVDVGHLRPHGG